MSWTSKVTIVTGASSGLGLYLSQALVGAGARTVMAARHAESLQAAASSLSSKGTTLAVPTDVTNDASVANLVRATVEKFGRVDAVFHCAGRSMRRAAIDTTPDEFREMIELNFLGAVRIARATVPELLKTRGSLVNIGSLAGKVGSRWYGAYPASKFCLTAYSQQLRLELGPQGLHVLLVCPGPIRRDDSTPRYEADVPGVPAEALRPGGGAKTRAIDPAKLAERILVACQRRDAELVMPGKARLLFAISQLWPGLGDWLLKKNT